MGAGAHRNAARAAPAAGQRERARLDTDEAEKARREGYRRCQDDEIECVLGFDLLPGASATACRVARRQGLDHHTLVSGTEGIGPGTRFEDMVRAVASCSPATLRTSIPANGACCSMLSSDRQKWGEPSMRSSRAYPRSSNSRCHHESWYPPIWKLVAPSCC